jgi:hypothetical protein
MATFTDKEQKEHRAAFIEDSAKKRGAPRAMRIGSGQSWDKLIADLAKLQTEDVKLLEEMHSLESAVDSHTKDNRSARPYRSAATSFPSKWNFSAAPFKKGG